MIEHYRRLCGVVALQMERSSRFTDFLLSIDPELLSWLRSTKTYEGAIDTKPSMTDHHADWRFATHILRCTLARFVDSRDPELYSGILRLRSLITLCEALSNG